jgi:deoxyribonuclease-4
MSKTIRDIPFILETPDDEGISLKEEIQMILKKWGGKG